MHDHSIIIQSFKESIYHICPFLTDEAWAYLEGNLTIKEFSNKHFFIQAETVQREIGYLVNGLMRGFYIDQKLGYCAFLCKKCANTVDRWVVTPADILA